MNTFTPGPWTPIWLDKRGALISKAIRTIGLRIIPGDHGFSHCADHQKVAYQWNAAHAKRDAAALAHQIKFQGREAA